MVLSLLKAIRSSAVDLLQITLAIVCETFAPPRWHMVLDFGGLTGGISSSGAVVWITRRQWFKGHTDRCGQWPHLSLKGVVRLASFENLFWHPMHIFVFVDGNYASVECQSEKL